MRARALVALAGLLIAVGCGDDGATVQHVDPITTAGTHLRYPQVNGFVRSYAIYVPESVDLNGPPLPAILVLHGNPPIDMAAATGMNEAAEEHGFIAVYPKSHEGAEWVIGCKSCTRNAALGVDDVAYLRVIIEALPIMLPVDEDRIYVAGFSNGGMMTYRAACKLSGEIAAFAPIAAGMWEWHTTSCGSTSDVPMMIVSGTNDPSFPYEGVPVETPEVGGDLLVAIEAGVAFWAGRNGCDTGTAATLMPDTHEDETTVHRWSFGACRAETLFYRINGGGHNWPGGPVPFTEALGPQTMDLAGTDSVVAFFLRQRR